jgi:dTDP-glucose 4,6-dehydratase
MNWSGKRVLVTGAGGFIGSHLTERLVELGATTRAFILYNSTGSHDWLDNSVHSREIEFFPGDIRDGPRVREAVKNVDFVFHLAALIAIPYSYHAPESYVQTNVLGTLNVLQAVRESGTRRIIHTSTSEVFGTAKYVPIDEDHPLQGQSPYSASKIGADKMAEAFHFSFDLPVVTLRPFNTFGPRQSTRAVVPTIVTQCLNGSTVRLGNLLPTRDLNYVANTVDGFIAAAESPNAIGRTINIGSGREISIRDLAALIGRLMDRDLRVDGDDPQRIRPDGSEVERLLASNALARELLGWEPSISLESGLMKTIEWIRSNRMSYRSDDYTL